jgi:hypothetical protein
MTYRLSDGSAPHATRVDVLSDINLAGPLAQFSKGAIMQEVANRITATFVGNFETRLSAATASPEAPAPHAAAQSLDAGHLLWTVLRERLRAFFRRLFGRSSVGL